MKTLDLPLGIEINSYGPTLTAAGPQNLVRLPHLRHDFLRRNHRDVGFGIQQYRVGLFVV